MSERLRHLCPCMLLSLLTLLPSAAGAMGPALTLDEDFTTTLYKDAAATTALWSTATGELKLTPFAASRLGSYTETGYAKGVALAGNVACVTSSTLGLLTIDIRNPAAPAYLGRRATGGTPLGVAVSGTTAYVAIGAGGLAIIDIAHPDAPATLGQYVTADLAYGVAVAGRFAYVATLGYGLTILDVSNPAAPTLVGHLATLDRAIAVAVDGDYAYVADNRAGLTAIDVSNPAAPVRRGSVEASAAATGVAVAGNLVALSVGTGGIQLFDVSSAGEPVPRGRLTLDGSATGVALHGELAFVTTTAPSLCAIDVSNVAEPTLKYSFRLDQPGRGVAMAGDLAWVAADLAGLVAVRVADTASMPALIGGVADYANLLHYSRGAAIAGDVACVAAQPTGLVTVSLADPAAMTLLGSIATPGEAVAVAVAGDLVCVADSLAGLRTYSIATPAAPVALGGYDTPGQAVDVALAGDVACVADGTGGLRLVNVASPAAPALLGACTLPGAANAVAVSGNYACVTDGALRVVNIANPAAPVLVGSYTGLGGAARGVAVAGTVAWVTAGAVGVYAIDIHNPAAPALLGAYPALANRSYWSPRLYGARLLALSTYNLSGVVDLLTFNAASPAAPTLLTSVTTNQSSGNGLAVGGDIALITRGFPNPATYGGVSPFQLAQSDVSGAHQGLGASLNVLGDPPPYIVRSRFTAQQAGHVDWSVDYGSIPRTINPDGTWYPTEGDDGLSWTANLLWDRANPTVTDLRIDWRLREARIDSIVDIPRDQGGWVNLYFTGSGYDYPGMSQQIAGYTVYREVESTLLAARVRAARDRLPALAKGLAAAPSGETTVELDGVTYLVNDSPDKSVPAGVWSIITSFYATRQDQYVVTVPTVADDGPDGTAWTKLYVAAHTTTIAQFYASTADSGHSIDNIAPGVPAGLTVSYASSATELTWLPAPETDFQYYRVYRGTTPGFTPDPQTLIQATAATSWTDPIAEPWLYSYKLTVVDAAGNESDAAAPQTVTGIDGAIVPSAFALRSASPNPFNPATTITYDVPQSAAPLRLSIYDTRGRLLRTLADGTQPPGRHSIRWDGRDDRGRAMPTGMYLCRLTAGGQVQSLKMSLVQ
ncbi:MAG: LVIVD repeat-containing protein [Candidatus Krumholzibacteriia bacterium]